MSRAVAVLEKDNLFDDIARPEPLAKEVVRLPSKRRELTDEQAILVIENQDHGTRLAWKFLHQWRIRLRHDDVQSIVGLALCEAACRFKKEFNTNFRTFFFYHLRGILLREVAELIKQRNLGRRVAQDSSSDDLPVADEEAIPLIERRTPEKLLQSKEMNDLCKSAYSKLDELEQQILVRHFIEEVSLNQIAEELGYCRCHISRVKNRALARLGRVLKPIEQEAEEIERNETDSNPRSRSGGLHNRRYTGGRGRRKDLTAKAA